ncbi:transcriptional regulator [Pseudomonas petrae]|uniref:transcriptional regulator n=1 Tax=Pseudomonas petrae TaxID=2912190 RepID=UPI001F231E4F|nr:YdaS family helix-turn-helix protein [Pseudomonas petrae]MCF7558879.1 helix-turn-helix domain-containing protein [Pseudomonas petrae]
MSNSPLASAVKIVGSQTALARILGCTPQNVQRMCATGKVPARHVLKIEAASGISRSLLSPDLYPLASPTLEQNIPTGATDCQVVGSAVRPSSASQASP